MTAETSPETAPDSVALTGNEGEIKPALSFVLLRRLPALAGLGVLLALLLYYPVGAWRVHVIDDDQSFSPAYQNGQSLAVAVAAGLLHREVDIHGWIPNKPFFMPAAILDDMPNYQLGIAGAVARFAAVMADTIGRSDDAADAELSRAAGLMQYPPNIWMIDPSVPWATVSSSDKQFRNAAWSLEAYNRKLAAGESGFDHRPAALRAVAERFARELEGIAATLSKPVDNKADWEADRAFWQAKGRAYATFLILRGLGADYAELLAARGLNDSWQQMLAEMAAAAAPRPWVVTAGHDDSLLFPNHLSNLGFHLLRAEGQLLALTEALR